VYLLQHLVPYNFVVPGQSENGLVTVDDLVRVLDLNRDVVAELWEQPKKSAHRIPANEFSGSTYRCVTLVADIPVRIDDLASGDPPAIAVVQAEIQLVDAPAALANEQGDNAHSLYKRRQREFVRRRLELADG
jgi:uncharacterized protein (TIGR04552 family)